MITSNVFILTGCVCAVIATCAFIRVCIEWLAHIDENCWSLHNIRVNTARIRAEVEKLCKEFEIDLDKKD